MRHDLELLTAAAGMRARGRSWTAIAEATGRNERTCRRWAELPEFKAEVERVRGDLTPSPRGVFVAALTARKDDGIDWQARLRAADALIEMVAVATDADADADLLDGWE
jgi:hypothetical protein